MALTAKQRQLLIAHQTALTAKREAEKLEREARAAFLAAMFPNGCEKGTNTVVIDDRYAAKVVKKLNYRVDAAKVPEVLKAIKEKHGVKVDCFKTKLELAEGKYNALPEEVRELLNDCITISDGSISVEVVEPKR